MIDDGELLLDGTPKEVFSRVELLSRVGLEAPQPTRLLHEMKAEGFPLPDGCVSIDECVTALEALWKEKTDGTVEA